MFQRILKGSFTYHFFFSIFAWICIVLDGVFLCVIRMISIIFWTFGRFLKICHS
jgi:hypothetical protein